MSIVLCSCEGVSLAEFKMSNMIQEMTTACVKIRYRRIGGVGRK